MCVLVCWLLGWPACAPHAYGHLAHVGLRWLLSVLGSVCTALLLMLLAWLMTARGGGTRVAAKQLHLQQCSDQSHAAGLPAAGLRTCLSLAAELWLHHCLRPATSVLSGQQVCSMTATASAQGGRLTTSWVWQLLCCWCVAVALVVLCHGCIFDQSPDLKTCLCMCHCSADPTRP